MKRILALLVITLLSFNLNHAQELEKSTLWKIEGKGISEGSYGDINANTAIQGNITARIIQRDISGVVACRYTNLRSRRSDQRLRAFVFLRPDNWCQWKKA